MADVSTEREEILTTAQNTARRNEIEDAARLEDAQQTGSIKKTSDVGVWGQGVSATKAWRERLAEQRAQGVIFRDAENDGPTELSKRGVNPRPLNIWQTGEDGRFAGLDVPAEKFPKVLPEGAIGWDDNGNPNYGGRTPFQEWQLQAHANLERSDQITEDQASWDDWAAPKIGEVLREEGGIAAGKALLGGIFETYKQTSESVDYLLAGGDEEVNRLQTGWRQASHYGAETLQRLGSVAFQTKLFFGGVAHLAEETFDFGSGVGDDAIHFTERNKELQAASDQFTVAPKHDDLFWRNAGIPTNWIDEYKQGALAGRMFYSTIWDNAVDSWRLGGPGGEGAAGNMRKEEFLREMKDNPNANPNLAVKKYENPGAEMWGEIIFDPLNVVEWGAKAVTGAVAISKASKLFAAPMGAVGDYLKSSKLTRVSGLIDDAQDIEKARGLIKARLVDIDTIAKADTKLAKSKSIIGLTNNAKAHVAAQEITAVNHWAWNMSKGADGVHDVDKFIEIQRAIIKSTGTPEEILESLNDLQKHPGWDIVFTEPGTRAGLMMKEAWAPGRVKKLRKALASDPDPAKGMRALIEASDEMTEKVTRKFFPDISDVAYEAKGGWKTLAKTHDYMQNGPYKLFNTFFSSIYMGLNPGFAARNVMQNSIQAALDEGIRGVANWKSLDEVLKWSGGAPPPGAITEFGTAVAGETNVKLKNKIFFGTFLAGEGEKAAGLNIFGKVYPNTMRRLLKKGLNRKNLMAEGLDRQMADHVLDRVIATGGDYNKVFDELIADATRGFYEASHNTLEWSADMVKWGDETSFGHPILEIMRTSETKQDALNSINKLFDDGWKAGDGVVDDFPVIGVDDIAADSIAARANMIDTYGIKSVKNDHKVVTSYHGVNTNSWNISHQTATEYKTNLASQLIADGHFANADEANNFLVAALKNDTIAGTDVKIVDIWGEMPELEKVRRAHSDLTGSAATASREIRNKKKVDLKKYWDEYELDKWYGTYSGQDRTDVISKIWSAQLKKSRPLFEGYRDMAAVGYKQSVDTWIEAAKSLGRTIPAEPEYGKLEAALNKARKFDDFMDVRDIGGPLTSALEDGDMKGVAIQFARMYGINTGDAVGAPLDQKLINIINAQLKRKFTDLDDLKGSVTPNDIEQALLAQALEETVGIYQTAGAEGFDLLRRSVGTLSDDIPVEDMQKIDATLDVVRQVDEKLAKNIETIFKQRDYEMRETLRRGRRMSPATRQESDNIVGELQAKLDDLVDNAQSRLEEFGALEPPTYLAKLDDPVKLLDGEVDDILEALEHVPDLRKDFGQAHAARMQAGATQLEDVEQTAEAAAEVAERIRKADAALAKQTAKVKAELGEAPQLDNLARELIDERQIDLSAVDKLNADLSYYSGENIPSTARQWMERRPSIRPMQKEFQDMVERTWGVKKPISSGKDTIKNLKKAKKYSGNIVEESRQISGQVALHKRNFILHDYGKKRNFDLAASYVMPYHFWYTRTYAAWLKRTVTHPGTMTAYLDYKDALQKMHGDMPDWWKSNLNTNELLGIDNDNPFYFNFEQTLSPLNGLLGSDFDDKDKSFSWFSNMMQDVGKFGPSIYTPIAWAIAGDAYRRGEDEAVKKWAGRLAPQTQMIKAVTAKFGLGPGGSGLELDPMIWLSQGGVDIWETRRVGRALGWAVDNGEITEEEADQAAMEGPGNEIYDNARGEAQSKRSGGQISSFFFGTGFKARTKEDLEIDKMDDEYNRFRIQRPDMTQDDVAGAYRYFAEKYPFFNTLQIARRDVDERDTAYAYNVLSRIPPGQTKEAYRAMGLEREQVDEFWENKGIPEDWSERERVNFTSAIMDVGTVLALPQDATQDEWIEVKKRNGELYDRAEEQFGEAVVELMDGYWELYAEDEEAAKALRDRNPILTEYQDFLTMGKVNDELLAKYYASYDQLRMMIQGRAYDELDKTYGPEFHAMYAEYNELRLSDPKKATAFYKAHPEIKQYKKDKTYQKALQAEHLIAFAHKLPTRTPAAILREDPTAPLPEERTREQEAIATGFDQPNVPEYYNWSWEDWSSMMTPALQSLVVDWAARNEELSYTAEQSLEYQIRDMDINIDLAKQLIRGAVQGRVYPE